MIATLHQGGTFTDERGTLEFVNENVPGNYRRFYIIIHPDIKIVRAWQGHLQEEKAFYAINGSFVIAVVHPRNFENPEDNESLEIFQINTENKNFLRVPGRNYTGIKALTSGAKLLVLSSMNLSGSKGDDFRQPAKRWLDWDSVGK